ncbi:AraC family transcriptional regulator [Paenibacillus sp. S-38]|uniref:AraC family transcriptional regulator n=1 Tax=Paenibacillus sp. S-38 TaxID=3416710 RepID=UPI003CF8B651
MEHASLYHPRYLEEECHLRTVAYYSKQWNGFQMPFHTHRAAEIMYVISGECAVEFAEGREQLGKGDLILIDALVPHRLIVQEDTVCRMLNVEFVPGPKQGVFPSLRQLAEENEVLRAMLGRVRPYLVLSDTGDVYHTLKSLVLELSDQSRGGFMVQLLLSQLLLRVARLAAEAEERQANPGDLYVKKVISYLHHHYDCDLRVKELAEAVNLHPSYLHRIFRMHTGSSIVEYLTALRIEKAKMLLAKTDIPVIEIPGYIGMNSRQYFSAVFKKQTGLTPLQYRLGVEAWQRDE